MEIGHRIARARSLAGLTQRELAKAVGVTPGLVGQWESHKKKPGRENLAKVAKATLVSMPYLMGDEAQDEMQVVINDPEKIDILRQYGRLTNRQRQNFRQLLGMSIEIRQQIEKHGAPTEDESVP